jgi:F0F1-type ATP synthase assembly protein I
MDNNKNNLNVWALALELGWQIAIPLVFLALAGRYADRYFDTAPWLLVTGVILAAISSTYMVYRKVIKIIK